MVDSLVRADNPVGWWDVALSLLLVVVAVAVSRQRSLRIEGLVLWATFRAAVQLTAVGFGLRFPMDR